MDANRKNVEAGKDVPDSIDDAKYAFNEFEGVIKNQTSTISAIKSFEKNTNSESTRNLEAKRFFSSLSEKIKR